jgi:hypothetical protein
MPPLSKYWRSVTPFFFATALALLSVTSTAATSYYHGPYPARALASTDQFLSCDSRHSVALYRLSDLSFVRRFSVWCSVEWWWVTADEKVLLVAGSVGSLSAFELATGQRLWRRFPFAHSHLNHYRAFSNDGQFLLVGDGDRQYVVLDIKTGVTVGELPLPPRQTMIKAAALGPNGTEGVLINSDGELYTFDVVTGQLTYTRSNSHRRVEHATYTSDGKYLLLINQPSDRDPKLQLQTVQVGGGWPVRDLGPPLRIRHIRPTADGSFLLTATEMERDPNTELFEETYTGFRWRPDAKELETLWHLPIGHWNSELMECFPDKLVGIRRPHFFETQVVDLRTGALLGTINNGTNLSNELDYKLGLPVSLPWSDEESMAYTAVVIGVAVGAWLAIRRRRRGKLRKATFLHKATIATTPFTNSSGSN